jgi:prephenate dehydrogenase
VNTEDDFAKSSVAIIGLGLMGGSLAMALRGRCKQLLGIDRDLDTLEMALSKGIVDIADTDPGAILPQADVVVLAVPVSTILEMLPRMPEFHPGPAVVLDLGSTKAQIMNRMEGLPLEFDPVGGHPMCGKESSGLLHADPSIYQGAPFALSSLERTSPNARAMAETMVRSVGASPIWLDPQIHDTWVAFTSHLPYLMAASLVNATSSEAASMLGPGFLGASRLAGSDPEMMVDILVTNRANILDALKQFQLELDNLEQVVKEGDRESLITILDRVHRQRSKLIGGRGVDEA